MTDRPLDGRVIGITAERRAEEQAELFRKRGADVMHGPALRIVTLAGDDDLRAVTDEVIARPPDYLLASTGFGMRAWLAAAGEWGVRDELVGALTNARVLNRGAKANSANSAAGLAEWWRAPDERFDEVVERVLGEPLDGRRVVMQLHARPEPDARTRLSAAGAEVVEVDAYRSTLPADPAPALALIGAACEARLDAVTFTTAPAVHNLFRLARDHGQADDLRDALSGPVVACCVGPVCAEGAAEEGVEWTLVPDRSRLAPMVKALTDHLAR